MSEKTKRKNSAREGTAVSDSDCQTESCGSLRQVEEIGSEIMQDDVILRDDVSRILKRLSTRLGVLSEFATGAGFDGRRRARWSYYERSQHRANAKRNEMAIMRTEQVIIEQEQ